MKDWIPLFQTLFISAWYMFDFCRLRYYKQNLVATWSFEVKTYFN